MTNHTVHLALGNPDRFRIVDLLAAEPSALSVRDIARLVECSQSQTSQHLATLRAAGLVVSRRDKNTIWNTLAPNVIWPIEVFR